MHSKGRMRIFSGYRPEELNEQTIAYILADALPIHLMNASDSEYLHRYRKGYQPILNRQKQNRPEICNKIVENHAEEIATFNVGFIFGSPITYVTRSKDELDETSDTKKEDKVNVLNTLSMCDNKSNTDRELGDWLFECGVGYKGTFPLDARQMKRKEKSAPPYHTAVLDPRTTFCVYSTNPSRDKLLTCCYSKKHLFGGTDIVEIIVYTDDFIYKSNVPYSTRIDNDTSDNATSWQDIVITGATQFVREPNLIGINPIVEYDATTTRMGSFEPVIEMLDALNEMASNRADGVEQFVQSFVKFVNCDIDENTFTAMKDLGAIKVSSNGQYQADVDIITSELNQDQTQTFVEDMYNKVLAIAGVPDRRASAGGNTGQALIIGQGWTNAESRAQAFEKLFTASEKETLRIVLAIMSGYPEYKLTGLETSEVEVKFTRNRTDNMLNKTQALLNQLQAGVHPLIALANCDLYSDPEKVFNLSKEFILPKWKNASEGNSGGSGITNTGNGMSLANAVNAERDMKANDTTKNGDNNAERDAQNKNNSVQ